MAGFSASLNPLLAEMRGLMARPSGSEELLHGPAHESVHYNIVLEFLDAEWSEWCHTWHICAEEAYGHID